MQKGSLASRIPLRSTRRPKASNAAMIRKTGNTPTTMLKRFGVAPACERGLSGFQVVSGTGRGTGGVRRVCGIRRLTCDDKPYHKQTHLVLQASSEGRRYCIKFSECVCLPPPVYFAPRDNSEVPLLSNTSARCSAAIQVLDATGSSL